MGTVRSAYLLAVGAAWDDGPAAGDWIGERLAPFGPSVGHAVPLGYPAYAVVAIPWDDDDDEEETLAPVIALETLLDVLAPFTGDQPVHTGMWPGFAWMYETGDDPRTAPGMAVGIAWPPDGPQPAPEEIDRALAEAREGMAAQRVETPDAEPLVLPHREYYLWTGPLRSALAFRHQAASPPSLIWPEDRSWFVGAPIYTNEIAVAGTPDLVDAIVRDPRLTARAATPDEELDIDD
jgi:hypothetical protein